MTAAGIDFGTTRSVATQFVIDSAIRAAHADGIHTMMDADAEMNRQASLDRGRRAERRDWSGCANVSGDDEFPADETEPPTMDA
jgi:hypothetical protein